MRRRGSVLLQVLITSILVSIIAAGLMSMVMGRHTTTARVAAGTASRKKADAAFGQLMSHWNSPANGVCASVMGYSCTGSPGTCGCLCTKMGEPTVTTTVQGAACKVEVEVLDP
jgi:hypothetical protein